MPRAKSHGSVEGCRTKVSKVMDVSHKVFDKMLQWFIFFKITEDTWTNTKLDVSHFCVYGTKGRVDIHNEKSKALQLTSEK